MTDLITKLEQATVGSRELDGEVAGSTGRLVFNSSAGPVWHGGEKETEPVPHYTTSLDAKLPGENIVSSYHDIGGWTAWHVSPEANAKQVMGRGHTEVLARRIASLKARE